LRGDRRSQCQRTDEGEDDEEESAFRGEQECASVSTGGARHNRGLCTHQSRRVRRHATGTMDGGMVGLLDKLKGVKKPAEGTPALPKADVTLRLLGLNNEQVPFTIAAGAGGDDGDVVAEWKIVDANWYEAFAKAGLEKSHRILLAVDEDAHEVRALEESWDVAREAGVPRLSMSAE
jgi:hypothetical protein